MQARDVPFKVDPEYASSDNLPGISPSKLGEVKYGGQMAKSMPHIPQTRRCQDPAWAVLFLMTVALTLGLAFLYMDEFDTSLNDDETFKNGETGEKAKAHIQTLSKHLTTIIVAGLAGAAASLVAAFMFLILARNCAKCVVYTSLYFVSAMMVLMGVSALIGGASMYGEATLDTNKASAMVMMASGGVLTAVGLCYTCCIYCCWGRFIPFTIVMVETVADIADDHPCMIVVSLLGSLFSFGWVTLVFVAMIGFKLKNETDFADQNKGLLKAGMGFTVFLLGWGGGVIHNTCHTVYAGLFGRWYFGHHDEPMLVPSIVAATTTSFGSICLGSLLVAIVRTLEFFARQAEDDARSNGNIVACIIMAIITMVISCIGDILEFFNEWAYIQCAMRGASFCQAARITYSLMTCANIKFIISSMLIDSVVTMGAFFCAMVGAGVGAGVGFGFQHAATREDVHMIGIVGALMGFMGGLFSGSSAMSIVGSGSKTILMCWAEDSQPLQKSHPDIHDELCEKLRAAHLGN
mmetsp:Transcript_58655/g.94906  ORF Transcript_58655/g.94906 Transcript_58655/m.94906 type:complete len:521 (-) Transcript_58655:369-1931(-)